MRDPKAIKKAIMTAKSVARLIDPHFGRVPMPALGKFGGDEAVEEHSPMIHEVYGEPMPDKYAAGGDVKPYQDPEASHISEWNWRPLEDVRSDLGYMREIPSHVLKFGDFMDEIAQRASNQGLTPRDLIKAYTITRSSIQRRAAKTDKVRQAGLPLHDFHDEMIRPEGAFGEWLHSPAGQAYLDAAEKGQVHHNAIEDAVRVMAPFGKHEKDIPDALSWAAVHLPGNEGRVSELIHAGRLKASHPSEWRDFTSGIRGIGPSKSGFYASLLGRGDQPTLDARQIILHTGRPTKEATRFLSRKGGAGGVEAVNRLTARQEAMGLELPDRLSPYYQHLAHHAVWDQAGGDETTHEDVMRSMRHAASGGAIMPHDHWVGQILHRLDNSDAEHYAGGGEVDDQHPYAVPNDLGLYSHAAVTAAGLPQERGTPEQFRGMLLNKGVKPAELHWGEYDYAFGDKPEVTRDEVAKHLWASMPNVEEKVLRRRQRGEPSASEISEKHYRERQSLYDEDLSPAEINQRRREMRERHAAERASAWHRDPHHEFYTIPGGENYREILLKHGSGDMYPGVPVHFGGEPDILTSMMVKDRQDHEGDKVLHVEELQSDWAQKGRQKGFRAPIDEDRFQRLNSMPDSVRTPEEEAELSDMYKKLQGIEPAPYVTKTEDWVDLGLKRALREAAEKGYDKLAWSPGEIIANRYNLADHVGQISHEKNEDGTYNLFVKDKKGKAIFDKEDMTPEEVSDYLGKGVSEQIFAGEGETGKEAHEQYDAAKSAYDAFLAKAALAYANSEMQGADIPEDRQEHMLRVLSRVAREGLDIHSRNRDTILGELGLGEEEAKLRSALEEAAVTRNLAPAYSPFRDWRHLKPENLQVGEKWPFEMYDRMIPKRALRLAKMHDPEAQLEKSEIVRGTNDSEGFIIPEEFGVSGDLAKTALHAIRITPQMRESILKKGFPAYAQGGEVEGYEVANPMSIFPKPQRMWDEDMPGGAYLSMPDKRDVTGHKASSASIGIGEGGKPYFNASRDPAEVTGSPGRGSATVKTNLFKQKAGWKWLDTPEGHENTNTLVSVEHRGKHHYVLHAHFPKGVDLARYPDAPSEPRLRPTTKGNVELGPQVGSISVRGKEHPVHAHAIVKSHGGEVEGYADGGDIDPEKIKEALRRIYSPLSDNPEHVQHALKIAQTYSTPLGGETGTGSFYRIKQSMPVSAVTAKVGNIPGINLKPIKKGSWEDFYNRAKGGVMVNVGGDLSGFGRLTHINNKPLAWPVDLHAGADYMREPNKGRVWANIGAHATSFSKKIREAEEAGKEVFGVLSPMGPTAVDSSHNMFDALMAQIPGAEIDPEDLKAFDEAIKRGEHLEADDRKNPKIMAALQQWPGLENAKEVSDFARPSSKKITGANRSSIVKFMGQEKWQKKGFPEVGVTRVAISNPDLVGIGGNKLGYRIARLSSKPIHSGGRSFEHSTYPVDTHGEYLQDVPLVERHHATPDVTEKIITSPYKGGIVAHPYSADDRGRSTYRQLFEQQKQMQPVNQRMLDSIMTAEENKAKYGFKKGGAVRKALMIAKGVKKK